jgi:TP901-1 family phage major tail protein
MASTGPIVGNDFFLYLNGTAIAYSRECTFSATADEIDLTSKDSARAYAMKPGRVKATITVSGLVALDSTSNAPLLTTAVKGTTAYAWKFSNNTAGDDYWHGATAYVVSFDASAPENGEMTFNASLTVSGTWNCTQKT